MKITILYASKSGNTAKAAEFIKDGLHTVSSFEVKLMNLLNEGDIDADFINESAAVIVGTPTYSANMAWQVKKWFDTDRAAKLSGKLGAAFATANYVYGGADLAVADLLHHMLVKGMLVYSSGTGCGAPIIHLGPIAVSTELDKSKDLFETFGARIGKKALELYSQP